ncbi:arylamine N-acetyltransferase [Kineosporia sp. A_224]|uniref:arylamine N-acetyltransferase family protein n=1 Tax=Kineosporia sp. A_224 TaxID=1962180 RepID=UPI00130453F7|nr:arylamine N-acetyltransferase [Kineosporia sp. A_224]
MSRRGGLDDDLRDGYLRRLGLDAEPPSVDALHRLHRRHVERVPYETLWIQAGLGWDVDAGAAARRIVHAGRGGYCYHLNGALAELLTTLGYRVTRHVGGVHEPAGPNPDAFHNHLVLTVAGLPSAENPDGVWYLDTGLGDALHTPLPLLTGFWRQGPYGLELSRPADGVGDRRLTVEGSAVSRMSWFDAPARQEDFAARHAWLATSPDSGFVRVGTAQRRDAAGADVMRGVVLGRVGGDPACRPVELARRPQWFEALADVFGLHFQGVPGEALDRLWERTIEGHRAWDAAGRP